MKIGCEIVLHCDTWKWSNFVWKIIKQGILGSEIISMTRFGLNHFLINSEK